MRPWHTAVEATGTGPAAMKAILTDINRMHCGGRCVVGSGGLGVGYLAHGRAFLPFQLLQLILVECVRGGELQCSLGVTGVHNSAYVEQPRKWCTTALKLNWASGGVV